MERCQKAHRLPRAASAVVAGGVRNAGRLLLLARLLARHRALFVFKRFAFGRSLMWAARRLAPVLQEAGPSLVRIGQALANRSALPGEDLDRDLAGFQHRSASPSSFVQVRAAIEEEFGKPLEALFRSFDERPVATTPIAQVYFAVDTQGREVAVKVLRPGIERFFARHLGLLFSLGRHAEANLPALRRLRLVASLQSLAEMVAVEMDLSLEAAAAAELAENFAGDPSFHVPAVDWLRTGRRVLTTTRVAGLKIDERDAIIAAGHDPCAVLTKAAEALFRQVFRDGFFHADLHSGNLFVCEDGSVAAVDFGIMGRMDWPTRRCLGEILLAFLRRDWRRVAEVHFEAGWVPANRSLDSVSQACQSIAEQIMEKPQNEISVAHLLGQLFQVSKIFEPQLLLLQKTVRLAEGTGRRLAPDANMWLLARPLIESWCAETLGPPSGMR